MADLEILGSLQENNQEDTKQVNNQKGRYNVLFTKITLKKVRKVKLTGGNLILDNPVPNKYLQRVKRRDENEFTHMRYVYQEELWAIGLI